MSRAEEDSQLLSMAFNAGIACMTQIMCDHDGPELDAIVKASHNIALRQLSDILDKPPEDVALFIAPYIKPLENTIDNIIKEFAD